MSILTGNPLQIAHGHTHRSRLGATALAAVIVVAVGGVLALVAWLIPTSRGQEAQLDDFERELERDSEPSA